MEAHERASSSTGPAVQHQIWGLTDSQAGGRRSDACLDAVDTEHEHESTLAQHKIWGRIELQEGDSSSDTRKTEGSSECDAKLQMQIAMITNISMHSESGTMSDNATSSSEQQEDSSLERHLLESVQGRDQEPRGSNDDPYKPEDDQDGGGDAHAMGKCRPCHYFLHTKVGCVNGDDCKFCHLDHPQRQRPRPCKSARLKCKRMAGMVDPVEAGNPTGLTDTVQQLSKNPTHRGYLASILKSKMRTTNTDQEGGQGHARGRREPGEGDPAAKGTPLSL